MISALAVLFYTFASDCVTCVLDKRMLRWLRHALASMVTAASVTMSVDINHEK